MEGVLSSFKGGSKEDCFEILLLRLLEFVEKVRLDRQAREN